MATDPLREALEQIVALPTVRHLADRDAWPRDGVRRAVPRPVQVRRGD